ncbi:MAG: SDR family NAD(P)-dependent oxidoreductase, partial [Acidobacteriota bacterium]|nr:SDR family NAD(P)-dependent oxidoreductase [Acidobacteriota bacterium]
ADAERAVGEAIGQFGAPTHLVTSAGQAIPGYFDALDVEVFETLNAANYLGTVYTVKAAYPHMRAAGGGRIGIVSSGAGLVGIFGYTAYGATKYAVRGFAECLRAEARRDNISVTVAYPGDTDTPLLTEESKIRPVETTAVAGGAAVWPAHRVAARIWRGMERKKIAVTPGWEMTALYRLQSVIDPVLRRAFDRIADRAKRA